MGASPPKAIINHFPQSGGNRTTEAPEVVGVCVCVCVCVWKALPPNDSSIASTSRNSPPFFQKRLANKQMFRQRIKHYHQWLRPAIHLKTTIGQSSPDSFRLQGPSQRTSSDLLHPVSSVKEHNRKGGKCKISRVLQSPVSSPQASPKVEASGRPKQTQCLPTRRKVQNGNTRVHQGLSDSRGMGVIDRFIRCLPSHPHPPKLKEVPTVLPQVFQFTSLPFGLATAPQVFTMLVKEVKLMALTRGIRLYQYLDRLADQGPVSEEAQMNTQTVVDLTQVDNKAGEIRTKTCSSVFICGLRIPSRFSPCKTHSREMAQTSGFDPMSQVKTCFDCKMFDAANWVARLNRENGPGGTPSHEALSVSPQGTLEISSVVGQPPSLDRNHFSTPRLMAKSHKRDERGRPSSLRPQYPTLYRSLKRRLGHSRSLRYYLDRTKNLRGSLSLLFISFKKGQTSDSLYSRLG